MRCLPGGGYHVRGTCDTAYQAIGEVGLTEGFDPTALHEEFRDEAQRQADALDAALIALEERGALEPGQRSEVLRALHTLKGNAGMLEFGAIRDFVHAVEGTLKDPPDRWSQPLLDRLFEGAAALRSAIRVAGDEGQDSAFAVLRAMMPDDPEVGFARTEAVTAGEEVEEKAAAEPVADRPQDSTADGPDSRRAEGAEDAEDAAPAPETLSQTETLRVPFRKLDALLGEAGELITIESELRQILRDVKQDEVDPSAVGRELGQSVDRLSAVSEALRTAVLDLRLIPVGRMLARFPTLVRDLAREENKRVRVQLEGGDTELDKSTVDLLAEPLLHLVRNAVHHGIEAPAEREGFGKPPTGTIRIVAERTGDRVRISVEDDGRGLDLEAIHSRARELELLDRGDAPSPEELSELIFRPGFSTRRAANTVSGRGIGLDAVRRSVGLLRGSLDVDSRDIGTTFVLTLPVRIAIVPTLLFESSGEIFGIPAANVQETLKLPERRRLGATEVVRLRGETIPIAYPGDAFGWEEAADQHAFMVVARGGERGVAIPARRLLDQQEVVVRGMPSYFGETRGLSGLTVLPGGRVVLLLDPVGLIELNIEVREGYAAEN